MTATRQFQTAIATAILLTAGAACSTNASSPPADVVPLAAPAESPLADVGTAEIVEPQPESAVEAGTSSPTPHPEAEPPPEPAPDPTPDPDPEPTPDPAPDPDPVELLPPGDPDPDPDPGPGPGLTLGEVNPSVLDAVIANVPACGLYLPIPDNASSVSSVVVDAAGDGVADDTVTSYYDIDDGQWRIRLIPSVGGVSEVTIAGVGPGYVEVLGGVHIDTDDAEQILAVVGSGASSLVLGVFGADADGCLFQFTWHGSAEPVTFAVGATIGNMSGLQCYESDGWRYLSSISAVSNGPGSGSWNIYGGDAIRESEQTLQAGDGIHVIGVPDGDPQLAVVPTINCPAITI